MSNNQMTLFQHDTGQGPSQKFGALTAAGLGAELGDGIRASYAILSIKAGRWRIKYKGNETPIQAVNPNTGRAEPVPTLEMVIVKANGFLNKQFYEGKYVEGSNSPPTCYSLDGKVPSAAVAKPVFSNCALCPKNQWGSLIGDNGVKQKACRDTKKLAVVPLGNIRNGELGGAMLFRVPPSSLKDLSSLADAMKARGYPYNSVAVRFGFDLDASHPKPTFQGIRPLTDDEADLVLEMYESDSVAAVLADNDVALEHGNAPQQARDPGQFEQEPVVGLGARSPMAPQQQPVQAPIGNVQQPQFAPPPQAQQQAPVQEGPTQFVYETPPPPPPGMHGAVVQGVTGPAPAGPTQAPPPAQPAFAGFNTSFQPGTPVPQAPPSILDPMAAQQQAPQAAQAPGKPRVRQRQPVVQPAVQAPQQAPQQVLVQPSPEQAAPDQSALDNDIGNILKGLSAFTGNK